MNSNKVLRIEKQMFEHPECLLHNLYELRWENTTNSISNLFTFSYLLHESRTPEGKKELEYLANKEIKAYSFPTYEVRNIHPLINKMLDTKLEKDLFYLTYDYKYMDLNITRRIETAPEIIYKSIKNREGFILRLTSLIKKINDTKYIFMFPINPFFVFLRYKLGYYEKYKDTLTYYAIEKCISKITENDIYKINKKKLFNKKEEDYFLFILSYILLADEKKTKDLKLNLWLIADKLQKLLDKHINFQKLNKLIVENEILDYISYIPDTDKKIIDNQLAENYSLWTPSNFYRKEPIYLENHQLCKSISKTVFKKDLLTINEIYKYGKNKISNLNVSEEIKELIDFYYEYQSLCIDFPLNRKDIVYKYISSNKIINTLINNKGLANIFNSEPSSYTIYCYVAGRKTDLSIISDKIIKTLTQGENIVSLFLVPYFLKRYKKHLSKYSIESWRRFYTTIIEKENKEFQAYYLSDFIYIIFNILSYYIRCYRPLAIFTEEIRKLFLQNKILVDELINVYRNIVVRKKNNESFYQQFLSIEMYYEHLQKATKYNDKELLQNYYLPLLKLLSIFSLVIEPKDLNFSEVNLKNIDLTINLTNIKFLQDISNSSSLHEIKENLEIDEFFNLPNSLTYKGKIKVLDKLTSSIIKNNKSNNKKDIVQYLKLIQTTMELEYQ